MLKSRPKKSIHYRNVKLNWLYKRKLLYNKNEIEIRSFAQLLLELDELLFLLFLCLSPLLLLLLFLYPPLSSVLSGLSRLNSLGFLAEISVKSTFVAISGEMAVLAAVETSLGSVTSVSEISSGSSSIVSEPIISVSSTSESSSSSVTSVTELSSSVASWGLNLDFLSVNDLSVHTKLSLW